jgi:hypothetical protein
METKSRDQLVLMILRIQAFKDQIQPRTLNVNPQTGLILKRHQDKIKTLLDLQSANLELLLNSN